MTFTLDRAVAVWRQTLRRRGAFSDTVLDELEEHLREDIDRLTAQGRPPRDAFYEASFRFGHADVLAEEYRKLDAPGRSAKRPAWQHPAWVPVMLSNYVKITLRNLRKQKGYALINVLGLAIGLAASLVIALYVRDELSYDRYHEKADRIYRVGLEGLIGAQHVFTGDTPPPMAPALLAEVPAVEAATRIENTGRMLIRYEDRAFYEPAVLWSDSTFFDVFTHPFLQGDPATALDEPNTVVLTETMARKYFGEADAIGRTIQFDNQTDYRVTGVVRDVPPNSHFTFNFLASYSTISPDELIWVNNTLHTYIVLREGATPEAVEARLEEMVTKYASPAIEALIGVTWAQAKAQGMKYEYYLEALPDLYLFSDTDAMGEQSSISYVYILSAVAAFILLIACINFMNLATARSAQRAKEVGLRKVLGSTRRSLMQQFLGESVIMAAISLAVALGLVAAVLPAFNDVTAKSLSLWTGGWFVPLVVVIALLAGLLAGLYPAVVLSAFEPVRVLKGDVNRGRGGSLFRNALVVTQFAISIVLLAGTGIVYNQLRYIQDKEMGFAGEQVVVLPLETEAGREGFEAFRQELTAYDGIVDAAASSFLPGHVNNTTTFRPEGGTENQFYIMAQGYVTFDYFSTLGLDMAAGRGFSRDFATDSTDALVINEAAAVEMGLTAEEALGRRIIMPFSDDELDVRTIVGVLKDFHFESLHAAIRPLALTVDPNFCFYAALRVRPEHVPETLDRLEKVWAAFEPGYPFSYYFLDDDFGRFYDNERRLGEVFGYFTALAMFIACLGLFGLASFVTQQRTKEIGVRKALGASVPGIVVLLSKEFTKLVGIASVVAVPVAYLLMGRWLRSFAYQVDLSLWVFAAAAVAALVIAWGTVGYQSIRAARANPIRALRYE